LGCREKGERYRNLDHELFNALQGPLFALDCSYDISCRFTRASSGTPDQICENTRDARAVTCTCPSRYTFLAFGADRAAQIIDRTYLPPIFHTAAHFQPCPYYNKDALPVGAFLGCNACLIISLFQVCTKL
jgi:hypothetical protein